MKIGGSERRADHRYHVELPLRVTWRDANGEWCEADGLAEDISRTGIFFVVPTMISANEPVQFELVSPTSHPSRRTANKVCGPARAPGNIWQCPTRGDVGRCRSSDPRTHRRCPAAFPGFTFALSLMFSPFGEGIHQPRPFKFLTGSAEHGGRFGNCLLGTWKESGEFVVCGRRFFRVDVCFPNDRHEV